MAKAGTGARVKLRAHFLANIGRVMTLDSGKISTKDMQASLEKVHAAQAEWHAELVNLREVVAAMPFPEQQLDLQAAWLRIEHRDRLLEALRQELHTRLNQDRSFLPRV